jgi:hypothetical protein
VLVRRGVEDDLGPVLLEDSVQAAGITDIGNDGVDGKWQMADGRWQMA